MLSEANRRPRCATFDLATSVETRSPPIERPYIYKHGPGPAPARSASRLARARSGAAVASPATVSQWSRFEAAWDPGTAPANPFDPDQIDVRAEFRSPCGKSAPAR